MVSQPNFKGLNLALSDAVWYCLYLGLSDVSGLSFERDTAGSLTQTHK